MAGRRAPSRQPLVQAQTPKVGDPQTQRALDVVQQAILDLQARRHLEQFTAIEPGYVPESGGGTFDFLAADGTWKTIAGAGLVDSVAAGSSMVSVVPTTGNVVVDVVPANFTGIPQSGITFSGTNNRISKFSGTTLTDSTITDTGSLVTVANPLAVTGTLNVDGAATFQSSINVKGSATIGDAAGDAHVINGTADFNHAVNMDSTLTLSPMTAGSLLFAGTGGLVSQDNPNLFWDDTNNHLCLNTAGANSNNTGFSGSAIAQVELSRNAAITTMAAASFGTSVHPQHYFIRGRGTRAVPAAVQSGDVLGYFVGAGYGDGTVNRFGGGAGVKFVADGATWTTSSHPGAVVLDTVPSGSTTSVDRVRVSQAGHVGIGLNTGIDPTYRLSVYSPGNSGTAGQVLKAQYYGLALGSEQTTSTYYLFNVIKGMNSGGGMGWDGGGSTVFYVRADGNVGIGNSSPSTTLDVSGTLNATGAVTLGSTMNVVGNFSVATNKFTVTAASGNTLVAGTLDATGNFNVNTNKFSVVASNGNTTVAGTLGVTGLSTLTGGFTLGAASSAGSFKITSLANGTVSTDAAAFGQIATAVSAAVSGTANTIAKFTGTNVVGNSSVTDDGTTVAVTGLFTTTSTNSTTNATTLTHTTTAGATSGVNTMRVLSNGTYTTAGGAIEARGLSILASGTRSAGASDLTNVAAKFDATSGQVNVAVYTANGSNYFNTSAGNTGVGYSLGATLAEKLSVTGNVTMTGNLFVASSAGAGSQGYFLIASDTTATTNGRNGFRFEAGSGGSFFIDSKTFSGGSTAFRCGAGAEAGSAREWLVVDNGTGDASFVQNLRGFTDNKYFAWDSGADLRVGFTKKSGASPKVTYGSATDFAIAQSSGTGIEASNTFTDKLTISAAGAIGLVGATTVSSTLGVNGNATLGDSTSADSHTVNGPLSIVSTATSSPVVYAQYSGTGQTADRAAFQAYMTGSRNTTAGAGQMTGFLVQVDSTRSAGANTLTNVGIQATVSGAQVNTAFNGNGSDYNFYGSGTGKLYNLGDLQIDGATVLGNASTDTVYVPGYASFGVVTDSTVGLKVRAARTYGCYVENNSTGATNDLVGFQVLNTATLDCTAAGRIAYGTAGAVTATRSAGANNLTNVGLYGYASGGQVNRGLWVDTGTAQIDEALNVDGAATFNGNVTVGDNAADAHSLTGTLNANGTAGTAGQSLTVNPAGVPAWGVDSASITGTAAIADTETVVVAYVCAANELKAGTTFYVKAYCTQAGTNAATPTVRIRVGTTTLTGNIAATLTGAVGGSAVPSVFEGLVTVRTAGAGGTVIGGLDQNKQAVADAVNCLTATVAVDTTTANQRIELTFISGAAANTYTFQVASIQKIVA